MHVLDRFSDQRQLLSLRMAEDPEFYALCQDYEICVEALRYWSTADGPEAVARIEEYRNLVRELEAEIAADLRSV